MMRNTLRVAALSLALILSACATTEKINPGPALVGGRMQVKVDSAWNQVKVPNDQLVETLWTRDGFALDALRVWSGVREGANIAPDRQGQRPLTFRTQMGAEELIALFEGYYARGGHSFALDKATPVTFLGGPGTRYDFSWTRKDDNVKRAGMGFIAVRNGELHAIVFTAPRLVFFQRHAAEVERMAMSATLKP